MKKYPKAKQSTEYNVDDYTDEKRRCGIGIFSLPVSHKLTPACGPHDDKYTDIDYQREHTREQADAELYEDLRYLGASRVTAYSMWFLARVFGRYFWEVDETR